MQVSAGGLALIKRFEGIKLTAYPDPGTGGNPWTIGYGHTGKDVHRGLVWNLAQADAALVTDATHAEQQVLAMTTRLPTQQQLDALTSFQYNTGHLHGSTLLEMHNAGRFKDAAAQFNLWVHGGGRVLPGLVDRRKAESQLYLAGSGVASAPASPGNPAHRIINTPKLNVRAAPNSSGAILTQLSGGSEVTVVQDLGEWALVEYSPGKRGYLAAQFLRKE